MSADAIGIVVLVYVVGIFLTFLISMVSDIDDGAFMLAIMFLWPLWIIFGFIIGIIYSVKTGIRLIVEELRK